MRRTWQVVRTLVEDESGATMVEYAIMIALIAAICVAVIKIIGEKTNNAFSNVNSVL